MRTTLALTLTIDLLTGCALTPENEQRFQRAGRFVGAVVGAAAGAYINHYTGGYSK